MVSKEFRETGIDISKWQGVIDFKKVKSSGISFVIIKAGGSDKGFYKDYRFDDNYRLAKLAGLKVGCYYYAGKDFTSVQAGIEDAKRLRKIIHGKDFDYPVFIDVEETRPDQKKGATDAVIGFCSFLEKEKYFAGVYASDVSGFKERLEVDKLTAYTKWVAKYSTRKPSVVKDFGIWQYSSKGCIEGIDGYVDLDLSTIDYSAIIHKAQLNRG